MITPQQKDWREEVEKQAFKVYGMKKKTPKKGFENYELVKTPENVVTFGTLQHQNDNCEVIGNIYENSDLLV
jgi:hypothetical protein